MRRARLAIEALDAIQEDEEVAFNVRLLVSELVSNAVTHGANETCEHVHLLAEIVDRTLHVEVSDGGPGFLLGEGQPDLPQPDASEGRGLYLLRRLADRYGVNEQAQGGQVWFEIDLSR